MNKKNKIVTLILIILTGAYIAGLVSAISITDISVSPSEVAPGSRFSIDLTIKNDLSDDIENVEVSLDLSQVQFSPIKSSQGFIDEIDEGKSKSMEFELQANPDIAGGSYKIPVVIKYNIRNNANQITQQSLISVLVNSKPEFNLDSDNILIEKQKGKLDIKITNIGLTQAKFLEVDLGSGNYNTLSAIRVYIGNLNSDDFDTASYDIYAKNSGLLSFPITLRYRDSANKNYEEQKTLSLKAYSQQEALQLGLIQKSNTGVYIWIVVLVIVAYIIYRVVRGVLRRRKNKIKEV